MFIRLCPNCNSEIKYTLKSNYNRALRGNKTCKSCSQQEQKNNENYSDRNEKISIARKEYFKNIDKVEHQRQIDKFSESIRNTYQNRSDDWKEEWKKTCSITHEKFYIEYLSLEGKDLPINTKSIKTDMGYYTPDFEYDDFYVDIKSIFTLKVLLGLSSYSKTKKSNPKQLLKMKFISENIKPVKIILIDVVENDLLELTIDDILKLKENEINKDIFKKVKS